MENRLKFIRIRFNDGRIYEAPTDPILKYYASLLRRSQPHSYSDEESAISVANQRVTDNPDSLSEWARAMGWGELRKHAYLVEYAPPVRDLAEAEFSYSENETPISTERANDPAFTEFPLDFALSVIAAGGKICNIIDLKTHGATEPVAALVFVQGGEFITRFFVEGVQRLSDAVENAKQNILRSDHEQRRYCP